MPLSDINVVHFSGKQSPAEWMLNNYNKNKNDEFHIFVDDILVKSFLNVLNCDCQNRGNAAEVDAVTFRIRDITQAVANEWKEQLDMLIEENITLRELLCDPVRGQQSRKRKRRD